MIIEFVEKALNRRFKMLPLEDLNYSAPRQWCAFRTLFPYDQSIYSHMQTRVSKKYPRGNVEGYEGPLFCDEVVFDFDGGETAEEIDMARQDVRTLANRLATKYKLPVNDISLYFSGGKGFHLVVSAEHFGGFPNNEKVPEIVRETVRQLAGDLKTLDMGLYTVTRIIRLPNSKHEGTGLFKIPLKPEELSMEVEEITAIAASGPRPEIPRAWNKIILPKDGLVLLKENAITKPAQVSGQRDIEETVPKDDEGRFNLAVKLTQRKYSEEDYYNHNRNNYIFQLAAWCNDLGVGTAGDGQGVWNLIVNHLINDFEEVPSKWEPKDAKEFERTAVGVYERKPSDHGKKTDFVALERSVEGDRFKAELELIEVTKKLARTSLSLRDTRRFVAAINATSKLVLPEDKVSEVVLRHSGRNFQRDSGNIGYTTEELAPKYIERILPTLTGRHQTLGIPFVDEAEEYNYAGKYLQIFGKGGVGKSTLLMHIVRSFTAQHFRALHSTMEDSAVGIFKRVIMGLLQAEELRDAQENVVGYASQYPKLMSSIKDPARRDEAYQWMLRELRAKYGNRWIVDDVGGMSEELYSKLIEANIRKHGTVDMLGVDGHSMMARHGNEFESDVENAAGLKRLANKWDMLVADLIHVPTPVSREQRSLEYTPRSGTKVMEPADFYISLSSILDPEKSNIGDPQYYKEFVYMRYHGKRTSGKTLDGIMHIDPVTLTVSILDQPAKDFMQEYSTIF